jgi:hypothetical protein
MVSQKFYLCGDGVSTALELDISAVQTFDELQRSVAAFYGIVQPEGVARLESQNWRNCHRSQVQKNRSASQSAGILFAKYQVLKVFRGLATTSRVSGDN